MINSVLIHVKLLDYFFLIIQLTEICHFHFWDDAPPFVDKQWVNQSQHSMLACTGLGVCICYGNSGYETLRLIYKCAVMKVE